MRRALAIVHVAFEDLGTLGTELENAGFRVDLIEAAGAKWRDVDFISPDLVVVLGGPIGVYEQLAYPFLRDEIEGVRSRLDARRPIIGICLGAQIIAAALGARVYPGAQGKELGWGRLTPPASRSEGAVADLLAGEPSVLHWHGDTFDLPQGARLLASTDKYENQAFAIGDFALALQFHLEVTAGGLERWYVGHACELAQAKIDVNALRA